MTFRSRIPKKKRWGVRVTIDRAKFRAWLKAKAPKDVVGVRCEAGSCPLANFHNYGKREPPPYRIKIIADDETCVAETQEGSDTEVLQVPYWVEWFVKYLDEDIDEAGEMVTAAQALSVLERTP